MPDRPDKVDPIVRNGSRWPFGATPLCGPSALADRLQQGPTKLEQPLIQVIESSREHGGQLWGFV